MFYSLPNLCSSAVSECPAPWVFTCSLLNEVLGKEGKKARDKWINDPTTNHQCYSAFEGFNPSLRISEPKGVEEGNPPLRLHAFVADFDTTISQEELTAGIARISLRPNYYERTLSGNARLIWLFEKPVSFPNRKFAVEFLKMALARTRIENVAAALDKPAWEEPNRYYTNSGEWWTIDPDARVPYDLLKGWLVEVGDKHLWKKDRGAIDIPLPVVWAELQKRFPQRISEWTSEFVEGAQGPSFWIEGSVSPKSAIVKPTGMFTFASHAVKPFYGWADLLGKDFVDRYAAEMMGKAVEGIFFDGKTYFRQDGYGAWKPFAKEDIKDHLATDRGLSTVKDGGVPSEVSRAMQYIQNWQGIDGAAPFVYQPQGLIVRNGLRFLNTHTRKVISPAAGGAVTWGEHGPMPFTSKLLSGLWHPESKPANPLDHFLAWLQRFYVGAYHRDMESGQVIFLLGGPGVGKTFWNQGYLPYLMGGAEEAQDYLLGKTDFNSQLFEVPLWTVDDNSATIDVHTHRTFSAMTKKMAANTVFQYHAKFRVPCAVEWRGRLSITANSDEVSASIVPDMSISNLEKNSLYRIADVPFLEFPSRKECERLIRDEAPYLARYLMDYRPKDEVVGTSRYGVKAYHDEHLLLTAEQSSRSAGFLELLEDWRNVYFSERPEVKVWEGGALRLLKELNRDELNREVGLRGMNPNSVNQHLSALKSKRLEWLDADGTTGGRIWRIKRPAPVESKHLPVGRRFSNQQHA